MRCKICAKQQHYCHNCGYDEDLAPFAHGYCGWEHFIEGYDGLLSQVTRLQSAVRGWLPRIKVIVDHAPKPLDDRAFRIFEEMEKLLDA